MIDEVTQTWTHRLLKIEYLPAGELAKRFNTANFRGHPESQRDAVESSLDTLQWVDEISLSTNGDGPASLDNPDAIMWDGHERVEITLVRFGPTGLCPCKWYQLSKEETDFALMVKDQTAAMAELIPEKLAAMLERTKAMQVDPRLAGLLAGLRQQTGLNGNGKSADAEPKIDKAAELQKVWNTAVGQIWTLGNHRLAVGDCTDRAVVGAVMRGERAAACITDPPYGIQLETDPGEVNTDYKGWQGKKGRYASVIGDDKEYDPAPIFENFGYCAEMFLWGADYYAEKIPDKNKGGWLVWDKRSNQESGSILSPETLGSEFELCWSKQKHKRYIIRKIWGGLFGTETQDIRARVHPTQKPVEVIAWILERYTKTDDLIADPYSGSGTTLIACEQLGRKCRACEIDPGYAAVTLQRFFDATGQTPKLLGE